MDKLKDILRPGSKKDDEVMYGDAETRRASVGKAPQQEAPTLHTTEDGHKKDHSILRQMLNPGDDKYDEQRYGTTATTQPPDPNIMQTHPEHKKDHTILQQITNPNNEKYDERMFQETGATGGDRKSSITAHEPPQTIPQDAQLNTASGEKKKEHTILRQIMNPHGDKYDDQAFGKNATVAGGSSSATGEAQPPMASGAAAAHPAHRDVQSGSAAAGAGTSSTLAGAGAAEAARRHQQPQQEIRGPTTTTTTTTTTTMSGPRTHQTQQTHGSAGMAPEDRQGVKTAYDDSSHLGRNTAVAGGLAGAGAAGAGAYGASQRGDDPSKITERPHPLGGNHADTHVNPINAPEDSSALAGSQPTHSHAGRDAALAGGLVGAGAAGTGAYAGAQHNNLHNDPNSKITDRPHPLHNQGTGAHINPVNSPETAGAGSTIASRESHPGRDAALVGGTGLAGGAVASQLGGSRASSNPIGGSGAGLYSSTNDPAMGQGPTDNARAVSGSHPTGVTNASVPAEQLNQAPSDVQSATYTARAFPLGSGVHHTAGPHQTDTANRLDPHVPGEFPTETGEDRHGLNEPELRSAIGDSSGTAPSGPHTGRDAALAGGLAGAGAGGATAYGLSNRDPSSGQAPQQTSSAATGHPGGQGYPTAAGTSSVPAGQTSSQDHHYGRDAALAGGAGAAGVGAYELAKDKKEPSTHTGPHDTNVANASDSRVQSQPEQLKSVNKPKEPSMAGQGAQQPQQAQQQQQQQSHHYGRDAAVAGGAGVAGAGAYEALKDRDQVPSNMAQGGDPTVDASKHPAETWDPSRIAQKQKEIKNEKEGEPTSKAAEKAEKEQKSGGLFSSSDDKQDKKAAKQQEKEEKKAAKEQEKHEKEVAKEQEKHEKEEKKAAKEQEKIHKEEEKERKEAAKQQKKAEEEEEKEKKPSLISRILHPGRKEGEEEEGRSREGTPESSRLSSDNRVSEDQKGHHKLHKKSVEQQGNGGDNRPVEPHSGLPMNTEKYGSGAGGTDGSQQIGGYQEGQAGEEGVQGPDWDAIKKSNTPY